jgi:hypothetical protein
MLLNYLNQPQQQPPAQPAMTPEEESRTFGPEQTEGNGAMSSICGAGS